MCSTRTSRRVGETGRKAVSALDPARGPAPETGITSTPSPGTNMGKKNAAKATAIGTGVAAAPPRSPRTKRGVDTDEGAPGRT